MKRRGRPKKYRIVRIDPKISQFSPRGRPGRPDEVDLAMDQFEAVRLADLYGPGTKRSSQIYARFPADLQPDPKEGSEGLGQRLGRR